MFTDPLLQALWDQIQTILIFLSRPVVQQQLQAFLIATLVAWLLSDGLWYLLGKRILSWIKDRFSEEEQAYWRRGVFVLKQFGFPLLGIAAVSLAQWRLAYQDITASLLGEFILLFWAILIYRIFIAVLYAAFDDQYVRIYQYRLLAPLFALFITYEIINNLININLVGRLTLITLFDNAITVRAVVVTVIALFLLFNVARGIQDILKSVIFPRTTADPGTLNSALTIGRYFFIMIGLFIAFNTLGLDLSTLAFIGAGLSVGLGFGLQQIFANFISGIILLFEQSLRPGDVMSVEDEIGVVQNLSIRSTTIRTLDNIEVIIPNENILTSAVRTYTKTNRMVRIIVPVGVSYSSDPDQVREILLETAKEHSQIQSSPEPYVYFRAFGDSSINFDLAVWIDEPLRMNRILSELHYMIWYALADHEIEIPFPQRDLHVKSGIPWEVFKKEGDDPQETEET